MILLPDDKRALRNTRRTWTDKNGKKQPIMVDGYGKEYKVVKGSLDDIVDHLLGR